MLRIQVKYFLTPEGQLYFPIWYEEFHEVISKQDGFLGMSYNKANRYPVLYFQFETVKKLNKWVESDAYYKQIGKIEMYFEQSEEMKMEETVEES